MRKRELDAAIITELPDADPELKSLLITEEAMMVVTPPDCRSSDWREVLAVYPFIYGKLVSTLNYATLRVTHSHHDTS